MHRNVPIQTVLHMALKFPQFLVEPPDETARMSEVASVAGAETVPTDAGTILAIALDVGGEVLRCGGEIHRVEDTVIRICMAYGAKEVEVFAVTSLITAEVRMPDGSYANRIRRVAGAYNHLSRLEACNALSRAICASPMPAEQVRERLNAIHHYRPIPEWLRYLGGMLATGGFAVFFGGTLRDGVAAAAIGLAVMLIAHLGPAKMNSMVKTLLSSFTAGLLSVLVVWAGLGLQVDKIIIGTIMLEIPGVSFGTALRDLLCGDTLAGTMRLIPAVLQTLMIAAGYMAALILTSPLLGGVL